jgi:hypothetical protein
MRAALAGLALTLALTAPASAAPSLVKIGDFDRPLYVTSPPNDARVFVVEKDGVIRIAGSGVFADLQAITDSASSERGLLSMAFSPGYAINGRFYVFLTAKTDGSLKIYELRRSANPNVADPAYRRELVSIPHPGAANHNGGQLQFGRDGYLYASTGDGGTGGANAPDLTSELGKILRIDPATGAAAPGNPHNRIWAYGLRNPWRFSFDRGTGDLIIGDVGETTTEEINWVTGATPGRDLNFGWPTCEGPGTAGPCQADPVITRSHTPDGFCAIVGGYVVRDPSVPSLNGRYVYGDNCNTSIWSAAPRTGAGDAATALTVSALTSFGEDACGRVYAASLAGPVYRIQDGAGSSCAPATPGTADTTAPGLKVTLAGVKTAVRKRRLLVRMRCSEACRIALGTRLRKVRRLATRHRSLAANTRKTVPLKLSTALTRKIKRRRFVRIQVTVRATDAARNTRAVVRRGRITRR